MKRSKARHVLLATMVATLAIAGCGGSSDVTPAAYVKSLCKAVRTLARGYRTATIRFQAGTASLSSTAHLKQAVETWVGALVSDTGSARDALKAAGAPTVSGGGQIADSVVSAFSQSDDRLKAAQTQASHLPTSSRAALKAGLLKVNATIQQSQGSIQKLAPAQRDPQLHAAAQKEPACLALSSSA